MKKMLIAVAITLGITACASTNYNGITTPCNYCSAEYAYKKGATQDQVNAAADKAIVVFSNSRGMWGSIDGFAAGETFEKEIDKATRK